jgi:hypothetical protein
MSTEDWQRVKNFTMYKQFATDKEMEERMPALAIIGLLGIIVVIFVLCC